MARGRDPLFGEGRSDRFSVFQRVQIFSWIGEEIEALSLLGYARQEMRGQIGGNRNDERHALVLWQAYVAERPEYTVFEDRLDRALASHGLVPPEAYRAGSRTSTARVERRVL